MTTSVPSADQRPSSRTRHLLWAVVVMFVGLTVGAGAIALNTALDLEQAAIERQRWNQITTTLARLDSAVDALVVDTQDGGRTDMQTPANPDLSTSQVAETVAGLQSDLVVLLPAEEARIVEQLDLLVGTINSIVDISAAASEESAGNDRAEDRALSSLTEWHEIFRVRMDELTGLTLAGESERLAALNAQAGSRLFLFSFGVVLVGLLVLAAVLLVVRIGQRETELVAQLRHERRHIQAIVDCLPAAIAWKDIDLRLVGANRTARSQLERSGQTVAPGEAISAGAPDTTRDTWQQIEALERQVLTDNQLRRAEIEIQTERESRTYQFTSAAVVQDDNTIGVVTVGEDLTKSKQLEKELAQARRIESIGHLAAGVAHEINTPIQYVSDNTTFLEQSFDDVISGMNELAELCGDHDQPGAEQVLERLDIEFLQEEIPEAIAQSREGLARVTEIVRAMKDFSHPGTDVATHDLNQLIDSTAAVCINEWKYVADLDLDLDEQLPLIPCSGGQVKQVLLNLIINAAHAVAEANPDGSRGKINVQTRRLDDEVEVRVGDNGVGIEHHIQQRVFDHFFTTKPVGVGTGQGLSLVWDVITGHGGTVELDSTAGIGTTVILRLPTERRARETVETGDTGQSAAKHGDAAEPRRPRRLGRNFGSV